MGWLGVDPHNLLHMEASVFSLHVSSVHELVSELCRDGNQSSLLTESNSTPLTARLKSGQQCNQQEIYLLRPL